MMRYFVILFAFLAVFPFAGAIPHAFFGVETVLDTPRTSRYIRPSLPSGNLPMHDIRLQTRSGAVEQVHLSALRIDRVSLVFARNISSLPDDEFPMQATIKYGTEPDNLEHKMIVNARVYTTMNEYNSYLWNPPMGAPALSREDIVPLMNTASWAEPWWYVYSNFSLADVPENRSVSASYNNPASIYQSPLLFNAKLTDLRPNTRYYYNIDDEFTGNFTTLPLAGDFTKPFTLGLWADVGQTNVSVLNAEYMLKNVSPDLMLLAGDLSYADTYGPLWDTWGRLMEPLMSKKLTLFCDGNHELNAGNEQYIPYFYRYPTGYKESHSPTAEYYSFETGPMHVITLSSFTRFEKGSAQYRWLLRDLARFNRSLTPWLVVQFHVPWYCSSYGTGSRLLMREAMEPILYKYGVDFILEGHVHVYERTFPVFNNVTNPCGPVHLVIGDAGNREGPSLPFIDPQPSWSAFREGSFGVGKMVIYNDTHAHFEWHRVACEDTNATVCVTPGDNSAQAHDISDSAWIVRNLTQCPNRLMPVTSL